MPRLTNIAAGEIESLSAAGIQLSPAEIVWINDLGRAVETADIAIPAAAGAPVQCGRLWLWPFSIQAARWYSEHACRLFEQVDFLTYCLGFALNLGREEYLPAYCGPRLTFSHLTTYTPAHSAVSAWAVRLPVTLAQLRACILEVLPDMDAPHQLPRPKASPDPDFDMLSELAAGSGQPADYWARQLCDSALSTLRAIYRQKAAAAGAPATLSEPFRRAMWEFQAASDCIRKARLSAQGPAPRSCPMTSTPCPCQAPTVPHVK